MQDRTSTRLVVLLLLVFVAGGALDLVLDAPSSILEPHVIFEIGLILAGLALALVLARGWYGAERDLARAKTDLARSDVEREAWRRSAETALVGLGQAIEQQFERWGLTAVESEIALSLLQGKSLKAIAHRSDRSERTVRQHAVAVYRKSGLGGRAELAGFFLDQLVLPGMPGVDEDHDAAADRA